MPSIFSRILSRDLPSFGIKESERFYAFLDIHPVQPGHTLVIPKVEVDEFFDLDSEYLSSIMVFAKPIAAALKEVTGSDRVGLVVAGFDVPHAHVHLIPINQMADLDFRLAKSRDTSELSAMAAKIREVIS
ncbi:MAG: HIT family protein [Sulfobacillus sp.]